MALFTKSIQEVSSTKDGVRICIMRRPDTMEGFDIWLPKLSPSSELLTKYHEKEINWEEYEEIFSEKVLSKNDYINIVGEIALKRDVTLLCFEKTPEKCHRRLVAEEIKRHFPELKVIIR